MHVVEAIGPDSSHFAALSAPAPQVRRLNNNGGNYESQIVVRQQTRDSILNWEQGRVNG